MNDPWDVKALISSIALLQKVSILSHRCSELDRENTALQQSILALQGEVYGARLASKYLDKELAGR